MALRDHARLAHLIERAAQRALHITTEPEISASIPVPEPPPINEPEPPLEPDLGASATRFAREIGPEHLAGHQTGASRDLYSRLKPDDVAEVEKLIDQTPELKAFYSADASPETRRHMILAFGVWLGVPAVLLKSGLSAAQPPEEIHVMARGPIAAAGGLYEADMIYDALAGVGVDMASMKSALDFGCSSGRVVRVLSALCPDIQWHGCDPNGPAIAWASENLPGIEFFVNDHGPPLPLSTGSLDLAYAISIWSHFAPDLGLYWFNEMHRAIRPGGYLVCTTHGMMSVAHYALDGLRTPQQSDEILDALYRRGWWYAPEFGEQGDWGVINPEWGTAFLSTEWMLTRLCPKWRVLEFAPGRNQGNQDVYVLQRV